MGRGIALVLAKEEGCRVHATARDGEALEALTEEVSQTGEKGRFIPCVLDQNDDQAVEAFVKDFEAKENRVVLLVNSAYAGLVAIPPHSASLSGSNLFLCMMLRSRSDFEAPI